MKGFKQQIQNNWYLRRTNFPSQQRQKTCWKRRNPEISFNPITLFRHTARDL